MYIVVGQGAAGVSAAAKLREVDPLTPVTIITGERDYFYSRIDLPDIVGGKHKSGDSLIYGSEYFAEHNITCRMGETVTDIIPADMAVTLASGERLTYKRLLLATGSLPAVPSLPGVHYAGIHTLWTLQQAREIVAELPVTRHAVVIGAGLIGLKTALAIASRGIKVTVIESLSRLLPRQLDETGSQLLTDKVMAMGAELLLNTSVKAFSATGGRVSGVQVPGLLIDCDLVVIAVGTKPNTELAARCGIKLNRGIVVDEFMRTSDQHIYAAGDVCEVMDILSGRATVPAIWPVAVEQGAIAGVNMTGGKLAYVGSLAKNSVEIAGLPIVSVGDIEEKPGDDVFHPRGPGYKKIVIRDGKVRGVLFIGDIRQVGVIASLVDRQMSAPWERMPTRGVNVPELLAL